MMQARFLAATAVALVFASTAAAAQTGQPQVPPEQNAPPTNTQTDTTVAAQTKTENAQASGETIVVTGSRLPTTRLDSPNPIVQVTTTQLEQTGTDNLERALVQLPQVAPGFTDTNSQNFYAAAGLNLLDLRHLGFGRTLVLVNGRRQVSGDVSTQAVDINSIPSPLVDRVEVVTGGLSAIYGADAVSGVVNIILKNHYEGLDVRARGGLTRYGDGLQLGLSALGGHTFADSRANVTAAVALDLTKGVNALQRPWGRDTISVIPNNNQTGPDSPQFITVHHASFFDLNQLGLIILPPFGPSDFFTPINGGTAVRPYDFGDLSQQSIADIFNNGVQLGGDGGYFRPFDNLSLPTKRAVGSLNFTYELSPAAEFFLEGRWAATWIKDRWQPTADFEYGVIFLDNNNPFVPADLRAIATARGLPGVLFGREYADIKPYRGADDFRFMQQYTTGVRGDLGSRFKYEAFAGYGRTHLRAELTGGRNQERFLQTVDVITLNGQPACADPAARAAGCQPFNPFDPLSTPGGIAYARAEDTFTAYQTLAMAGGNINGDLFKLPGGMASGAVGVEARRYVTDNSAGQCGIQMLCSDPEHGHVGVKEIFGELRLPVLANLPAINELTVQGAARYSDYNTNGGHTSWNLGGVYSPFRGFNFRVMRSRSVRAPNVDELFATKSQSFTNVDDPCSILNLPLNPNRTANCAALGVPPGFAQTPSSKSVFFGGNPDLDVETANTWTAGVTIAPALIPHLSATVDYFDIDLTDAIGALDPQTILNTCTDLPVDPSSNPACAAIERDPTTHQIANIFSNNQNFGRLHTRGLDFEVAYNLPLQAVSSSLGGNLNLDVKATHLFKLRQFDNAADPNTEHKFEGFRGLPKWEVLGTGTYSTGKWAFTWRMRYFSSTSIFGSDLVTQPRPPHIFDLETTGSKLYNDVSISYDINPDTNIRFNADNIFNVRPPERPFNINEGISNGSPYAAAGIYPNLGTMFSVVLQHRFGGSPAPTPPAPPALLPPPPPPPATQTCSNGSVISATEICPVPPAPPPPPAAAPERG